MNNNNPYLTKLLWLMLGLITLSAVTLIDNYSPYIPDYDGLSYFEYAKIYNEWQFDYGDLKFSSFNLKDYVYFWPITNAPSVFLAAIFSSVLNVNLIPTFINTFYVVLFAIYVTKIRSVSYAFIAILLLCAHTLFYRLFTTLTSEFSVGLWIFAFLLTLISNHNKRSLLLSVLVIIGLFLRTIDIVFVLCATSTYCAISFLMHKNKGHIFETLLCTGLTLLLTLPIFYGHYKGAYIYVVESQSGMSSVAWKNMAGVFNGLDVPFKYIEYLQFYNPLLIPFCMILILGTFSLKSLINKELPILLGTVTATIFPLLIASTINIQTVFWVFSALTFIICELAFNFGNLVREKFVKMNSMYEIKIGFCFIPIVILAVYFLNASWKTENQYLKQQKKISGISYSISNILNKVSGTKFIASNFWGIGALDYNGLSWGRPRNVIYKGVADVYSKEKDASYYLTFDNDVNFFISAHDNYFFPNAFGINDQIKNTHKLFIEKSNDLGFIKIEEISQNGTNFDIWYRPSVQPYLQFLDFNDKWIATKLPIDIGNEELCKGHNVVGSLNLSINFPRVSPDYSPPFEISLLNERARNLVSSVVVNDYGNANVSLDINNIGCGKYILYFDKTFSTNDDTRKLSAEFIKLDSALKFNK